MSTFREWRSAGAGLGRTAVVGQLSDVADRLIGVPDDALTERVFLAGAELAKIAASMAFDEGVHRIAQRHYVTAVRMAKAGRDGSFGAVALADLARQSFDIGAADDGLEIVLMAQRGTRADATAAHALRGSVYAFERAVDVAEHTHVDSDPDNEPRWLRGFDGAELAGVIGARYRDLARHDRRQAHHAVDHLGQALLLRGAGHSRNRAFDLVSLARVHLLTGDPDHAAATVREALPLLDRHRPGRLARKLDDWRREASPFHAVAVVGETRDDIAHLVATAV